MMCFACVCMWCDLITCDRCAQYELTLVASDSLNENHTKIIITVRDVNDLPPVFPEKLYGKVLDEEMKTPFTMLQVHT